MVYKKWLVSLTVLCLMSGLSAMAGQAQQAEPAQKPSQSPETSPPEHPVQIGKHTIPQGASVYIDPMDGFGIPLAAAFMKKKVPLVLVVDKTLAQYEITGTTEKKKRSGGAKIAAMTVAGGLGAVATMDRMTGSIQIIDLRSSAVVYHYTGTKVDQPQSVAEACAKHIKDEAIAP